MTRYYEDLEVGQVYKHPVTRTATDVDNLLYVTLSHNPQPLHIDDEFAKKTMHGTRIVSSLWTLAFVNAQAVMPLTLGTTLGNLGYEEIRFPTPVRIGDTIRSETHIVSMRESAKYPNAGIVTFEHVGYNQRNEVVVRAKQVSLHLKKAHAIT
ncbi:MaoC family dehydratase [Alsobacter sp. SYSU M60028]|uniref:MaoC family dehydratase n=2 Tax=Alsobacter ponti TaxID=2962936 RepID=A0ABT1LFU7_9HYPH|nr:MaoC family dehydratase [Alsobacter ponti]MCP8939971.1 MaoC family dehydratase [Alsobacter ponti]